MGTVRYQTINGEILSEIRGGVRKQYVPDPLGSTVALADSTGAMTDTFEYWPYGEVRSRTGTSVTPFQFVGTLGYYRDSSSRTNVRARTLRADLGRWLTEDPAHRPKSEPNAYGYCLQSPVSKLDRSGLRETNTIVLDSCPGIVGAGKSCDACAEKYLCSTLPPGCTKFGGYGIRTHCCQTSAGCCSVDGFAYSVRGTPTGGGKCPPFCSTNFKASGLPNPQSQCVGYEGRYSCQPKKVISPTPTTGFHV